ncbi:MAG: HlyD family efflux transporter periplasmic adaptor subunit, partial [Elusimicrobia bacterium]|nr:HlyD family efflux transporter periplasmic adaptor subunit [Elusimicrobiota bacterium]MBD3412414.1 HlyD family efflux transporter periplasmic adaptor subunit [Elusimicrobiota bacterium]
VEPGQTVTNQDVVLVMSDRLILRAQVDETDIGMIAVNQKCQITLDAYPEHTIVGVVDHIAYEATTINNVTIYEVEVLPRTVPEYMRSGMTANVRFIVDSRTDVLTLPAGSIIERKDRTVVMPANGTKNNDKKFKKIKTGLSDGKNTEIVEGLQEGEKVLIPDVDFRASSNSSKNNPFMPGRRRRR